MLTRPTIGALGNKSKIRKLEIMHERAREELTIRRRERNALESMKSGLNDEIFTFEKQVDSLRAVQRLITEERHHFQI